MWQKNTKQLYGNLKNKHVYIYYNYVFMVSEDIPSDTLLLTNLINVHMLDQYLPLPLTTTTSFQLWIFVGIWTRPYRLETFQLRTCVKITTEVHCVLGVHIYK